MLRRIREQEEQTVRRALRTALEMETLFCACCGRVHPLYFEGYMQTDAAGSVTGVLLRLFGVWYAHLAPDADVQEVAAMLSMIAADAELCGEGASVCRIAAALHLEMESVPFLRLRTAVSARDARCVPAEGGAQLREVYELIAKTGVFAMPEFEEFYLLRRTLIAKGLSRTRAIWKDGYIAATASVLFESPDAAMLGMVATDPACRGAGFATALVAALCAELCSESKQVYIASYNPAALRIYERIGFVQIGEKGLLRLDALRQEGRA